MRLICNLHMLLIVSVMIYRSCLALSNDDFTLELRTAVRSLNKLLDYMLEPRNVVCDLVFGVILARGQLTVMKKNLLQKPPSSTTISDLYVLTLLENKCKEIYEIYKPITNSENARDYDKIAQKLVRDELWEVNNPLVGGNLVETGKEILKANLIQTLNLEEIKNFMLKGSPNEQQSDECIGYLLEPNACDTNSKCWELITNTNETHGYPLTHRLLYYQSARQLGCGNKIEFMDLTTRIRILCSDILLDQYHIIQEEFPLGSSDLFFEQTALCGIEGFVEFINPNFINKMVTLQRPTGCFSDNITEDRLINNASYKSSSHTRRKRDDGALEDGCTMHITGLATIYLTINIRAIIEYWNPELHISSAF